MLYLRFWKPESGLWNLSSLNLYCLNFLKLDILIWNLWTLKIKYGNKFLTKNMHKILHFKCSVLRILWLFESKSGGADFPPKEKFPVCSVRLCNRCLKCDRCLQEHFLKLVHMWQITVRSEELRAVSVWAFIWPWLRGSTKILSFSSAPWMGFWLAKGQDRAFSPNCRPEDSHPFLPPPGMTTRAHSILIIQGQISKNYGFLMEKKPFFFNRNTKNVWAFLLYLTCLTGDGSPPI